MSFYRRFASSKRNKTGAVKSFCALNHKHDSKLESAVCALLQLRMRAGEIVEMQAQDHVYLTKARILYIVDFKCALKDGSTLFVEAKGYEDMKWPMKKKLWKHYGPAPLEIWKGKYEAPYLDEVIVPVNNEMEMAA